jgi:NAD(P)H-dependent FMN reductase
MDPSNQLLVFAGSTRAGSWNRKLARVAADLARVAGAGVTHIELADFELPLYNADLEARGTPEAAIRLKELFHAHPGWIICSPEYNGSYTGLLKNTIDWVSSPVKGHPEWSSGTRPFEGKVVGLLSASPGALGGLTGRLSAIRLLPDSLQGRYNLVAKVEVNWDEGWSEELYLKRFRHPEAAWIEAIARPLHAELGIETNRVEVQPGAETLLLSRAVTGEKLGAEVPGPALAFEIGRHGASALLLANADLRPRNAFLTRQGGTERLTMVDYEYTLFDRALDLSGLDGRFDPKWLARFSDAELAQRGERRVVSRGAIQRTRRAFIDPRTASPAAIAAFREGWREVHVRARAGVSRIEELLRARLAMDPPLVVGTESYRRAFVPLDIADLKERIALDPDAACDLCF